VGTANVAEQRGARAGHETPDALGSNGDGENDSDSGGGGENDSDSACSRRDPNPTRAVNGVVAGRRPGGAR
jgi:hypothetical protein